MDASLPLPREDLKVFVTSEAPAKALQFSPAGRWPVVGDTDVRIEVWRDGKRFVVSIPRDRKEEG